MSICIVLLATVFNLIPRPVSVEVRSGSCVTDAARIIERKADRHLSKAVAGLPDFVREEAYSLEIRPRRIVVRSFTPTGALRARQTISQLKALGDTAACCRITDYPRFRHRGLMIDESRSFKGKEFLFKQMDLMALLKLNVLHLHLTDAAGWRIRIDAYPELTDKAAWRIGKSYFDWEKRGYPFAGEDVPDAYGGWYSKDDIRQIVAYAAERGINVIPEIEMPGHSMEVNRTYPGMACETADGKPLPFSWDLCPGREETFRFLETVLDEVMDLFPSEYIHIGGDEAVMKDWGRCVHCAARMQAEGMKDVHELQGYLIRRIDSFVRSRGRKIIGWDEILETGIPAEAAVQSWRGVDGGRKAAAAGHDVVMSPTTHCYFDYYQDLIRKEPPACGPLLSLRHCYSFEPLDGIPEDQQAHILGLQGNLWCEYIPEPLHAEYMLYPRALAIAETGWTPSGRKDYADFRLRAENFCKLLDAFGYNHFNLDTESPRARTVAFESSTRGFNYVVQEGGPVLSYNFDTGVRIIVDGEFVFKDMNSNGSVDPFEDWRLPAKERAADLYSRDPSDIRGVDYDPSLAPSQLEGMFSSWTVDNPFNFSL